MSIQTQHMLEPLASPFTFITFALLVYLFLIRRLRFSRASSLYSKYNIKSRSDFAHLTVDQSQEILKTLVELEFPTTFGLSILFALFRTYGIPSVTSLLVVTSEVASSKTCSKRIADTGVLLLEFCLNPPSSPRAIEASARMNYVHGTYVIAGRIKNEDMLHTLGLLALEPVRWVDRFEWRAMTDLERCASGTFWRAMAEKMQIDVSPLASAEAGWSDGLQFLEELQAWSEEYEERCMRPAKSNRRLVQAQLETMLIDLPHPIESLGRDVFYDIAGRRFRDAAMLPEPSRTVSNIFEGLIRKFTIRHLCLPRPEILRRTYIQPNLNKFGRYNSKEALAHPWYIEPTLMNRWGPTALLMRLLGRKVPGDNDKEYVPQGYKIAETGPEKMRLKGREEMQSDATRISAISRDGCPFGKIKPVEAH